MPAATVAAEEAVGAPASHPFTCNTCQVAFRGSDAQRVHMRSDWHRYNLKRRVASLPPLSSEVFAEKVLSAQASNSAAAAKATFEKSCTACQKTYYSENAFLNHIGSQKHKLKEASLRKNGGNADETASVMSGTFSMGEPINGPPSVAAPEPVVEKEFSEIVDGMKDTTISPQDPVSSRPHRPSPSQDDEQQQSSEEEEFQSSRCLFCNTDSSDLTSNVLHMGKSHGMFIPEKTYLVDLEGLLQYLYAKITQNNECLSCHKLKTTTPGIQTHMRDKGHCMIAFETEDEMIEIGQFYDFTSTYSDDEDQDGENGRTAEDGWETDSSASSCDSDEIGAVPIDPTLSNRERRSRAQEHNHSAFYSDYELHLPSGRTAGHRSLAKYFRQNLRNYPTPDERLARQQAIEDAPSAEEDDNGENRNRNSAMISRANGGMGMIGATDAQKREAQVADARERKRENRARRNYEWGVNRRNNHQKHFRDHLLQ